jgi:nucleoside-diphosphate-sugar epimerase
VVTASLDLANSLSKAPATCAVTGASGYVGSAIARHLADEGWEVRGLCRSRERILDTRVEFEPFELTTTPTAESLAGVAALVHVAYDFQLTGWSAIARVNIEGTRRLLTVAKDAGVERIVVISSIAAFPGARSMYGRSKLAIERMAIDAGAAVIRPGLVWGAPAASTFGALKRAVERLPVIPLGVPQDLKLRLVHEDDLTLLVGQLLRRWPMGSREVFVAAPKQAVTFLELLRSFALQAGKRRRFVSVPWRSVWLALRLVEVFGVTLPFRSDSLLSLVNSDLDPHSHATAAPEDLGVMLRPYPVL